MVPPSLLTLPPGPGRANPLAGAGGAMLVKIQPGEFYVTSPPELITTLVGSCVAACICDPGRGVGGMNHFMLPAGFGADAHSNRYGDQAMENLIQGVLAAGGRRERLEVKIFGGGNMGRTQSTVGERNVRFVKEFLQREKLTVIAGCLLGEVARKIVYEPGAGRAWVWKLPPLRHAEGEDPAGPPDLPPNQLERMGSQCRRSG